MMNVGLLHEIAQFLRGGAPSGVLLNWPPNPPAMDDLRTMDEELAELLRPVRNHSVSQIAKLNAERKKAEPPKEQWPPSLNVGVFSIDHTAEKRVRF